MMMMMIHLSESRSINAHVVDSRPHWGVVGGSRLCALTAARGKKRTGGAGRIKKPPSTLVAREEKRDSKKQRGGVFGGE